jgi:hypothetical protein
MNDLNKVFNDLIYETQKNYILYIPFEVVDNPIFIQIIDSFNLQLNQEMVDEYVDEFLIFEDSIDFKKVESYEVLKKNNTEKIANLLNNCFVIVELKDTLGTASFKFIFEKYLMFLTTITEIAGLLVDHYDRLYPETSKTPKMMLMKQESTLKAHLSDIEKNIGVTAEHYDNKALMSNLLKSEFLKPFTENKVENHTGSEIDNQDDKKYLRDYILDVNENNRIEIEKIIVKAYKNRNPRIIRFVLQCLVDLTLLNLNEKGKKTLVYESLKNSFNDESLKYPSIFRKLKDIDRVNDAGFKSIKQDVNILLSKYK